jgi:AcrR family transcriptional regulator
MSLSRADVVRGAVEILDGYGLEDLSMRRLAQLLGVQASALYWHVENKQTLLALVSDAILGGEDGPAAQPVAGSPLGEGVRAWANAFREALRGHRDGAELVASTISVGLGEVDPCVALRRHLSDAGLSAEDVRSSSRALVHFLLGHVTEEQTRNQMHALGVIKEYRPQVEDEDFSRGLDLLVTGIAGLPRG